MKIVKPSLEYIDSWLATIAECRAEDPDLTGPGSGVLMTSEINPENIEDYIQLSKDFAEGKNLPDGWVPCSNWWLIDNGKFIGAANFRHELNDALKEHGGHVGYFIRPSKRNQGYGLELLRQMKDVIKANGLEKMMVTCNDSNIGSQKIIERNDGVFERYSNVLHEGEKIRIYWIDLAKGEQ